MIDDDSHRHEPAGRGGDLARSFFGKPGQPTSGPVYSNGKGERALGSNVIPLTRPLTTVAPQYREVPQLLTFSAEVHEQLRCRNAFVGMITDNETLFKERLIKRYGKGALERGTLNVGHRWRDQISEMLVAEMVSDMIATAAAEPTHEVAEGFEFLLEIGFVN